jgi:tetratricopeptide (TPR) repeat protein
VNALRSGEARYENAFAAPVELDVIPALKIRPSLFPRSKSELVVIEKQFETGNYKIASEGCTGLLGTVRVENNAPYAQADKTGQTADPEKHDDILEIHDYAKEKSNQQSDLLAQIYRLRGQCYLALKKYQLAIADINKSISYHKYALNLYNFADRASIYKLTNQLRLAHEDEGRVKLLIESRSDGSFKYPIDEESGTTVNLR